MIPNETRWSDHYDALIKAEYSNGKWKRLQSDINIILSHAKGDILDKLTADNTLIAFLSVGEQRHEDAVALAVEVLSKLGIKF